MPGRRLTWVAVTGLVLSLTVVARLFLDADVSRTRFSPRGPGPEYQRDTLRLSGGMLSYVRYRSWERIVRCGTGRLAPGAPWHVRWQVQTRGTFRSVVGNVVYGGWRWTDSAKLFGTRIGVIFLAMMPVWPLAPVTLPPAAVWLHGRWRGRASRVGFPVAIAAASPA